MIFWDENWRMRRRPADWGSRGGPFLGREKVSTMPLSVEWAWCVLGEEGRQGDSSQGSVWGEVVWVGRERSLQALVKKKIDILFPNWWKVTGAFYHESGTIVCLQKRAGCWQESRVEGDQFAWRWLVGRYTRWWGVLALWSRPRNVGNGCIRKWTGPKYILEIQLEVLLNGLGRTSDLLIDLDNDLDRT